MKTCQWQHPDDYCFNMVEGRTEYCARHNRLIRKMATDEQKLSENIGRLKAKQKENNKVPRPQVNKVSEKRKELNKEYFKLADEFKRENPKCVVRANQYCTGKTESVHHKRGRGRYLLDVSTFLPCCLSCHGFIEANPQEAKERGWSESRLAKQEPTV